MKRRLEGMLTNAKWIRRVGLFYFVGALLLQFLDGKNEAVAVLILLQVGLVFQVVAGITERQDKRIAELEKKVKGVECKGV